MGNAAITCQTGTAVMGGMWNHSVLGLNHYGSRTVLGVQSVGVW